MQSLCCHGRQHVLSRALVRTTQQSHISSLRWGSRSIGLYGTYEKVMAPKPTLPQQSFGTHLCNQVAAALKEGDVENILWGSHLMQTYRVPAVLQELAFAVPRNKLEQAVASLTTQGFSMCHAADCPLTILRQSKWHMSYRNPSVHFHMSRLEPSWQEQQEWPWRTRDNTLQVFAMEDVLWELPAGKGPGFTNGQFNDIIPANDPSLRRGSELEGWGRFADSQTHVRIPTWQRYIEALILNLLGCERQLGWGGGWGSELALVKDQGGPYHLCHPDFKMFFPDVSGISRPYKDILAEAVQILSPRLLDTRYPPPKWVESS